jgi:histone deacetylase complex subunit SAP30
MTRDKSKRRVHKDQLALAVRKNFNALGVTESDVIVDWLYKSKHQGTPLLDFLVRHHLLTTI